jgi:hypothetical protein
MPVCPECGADNTEGAFSCRDCGGLLTSGPAHPEQQPAPGEPDAPRAPSEWSPEVASDVQPPGRGESQREAYLPPTRAKISPKVIGAVAAGLAVLVAVIVVLVLVLSGGSGNAEEAIQLVKDYLDNQEAYLDSSMFKDWEASGAEEDMEVSALFDVSAFGEEYSGLSGGYYQTKMSWKVNLKTGSVQTVIPGSE